MINYLGVRFGFISLSLGVTLSQLIVVIGGFKQSYEWILVGRTMFGIFSESRLTAQAAIVSFWFKGK